MNEEKTQSTHQPQQTTRPRRKKTILLLLSVITIVALYYLLPFLIVVFVAQPVKVEGTAMSPTLNNGDRVFIGKGVHELNRGDIVVFYYPADQSKSYIKRIIGMPGETIRMDQDGRLYINGDLTSEPYIAGERNRSPRPIPEQTLKEGHYYVMGDNRDASNDSRSFGPIEESLIYGKVVWRYWPLGKQFK